MLDTLRGEDPITLAPVPAQPSPLHLDPSSPPVPTYHFVGIGGVGMSALAYILAKQGFRVSGSDIVANGRTRRLEALGVRFIQGHTPEGLIGDPQVVYSSAIRPTNPELAAALGRGLTVWHRADLLAALFNHRSGIGVAGTHGKTTTSSMIGYVLLSAGWDPTLIIGGEVDAWGGNARLGQGEYWVAEVDESDGSLVRLYPKIGVVTNIELDHPDHYANLEQVIRAFQQYAQQSQTLVACLDCPNVAAHLSVEVGYSLSGHPQAQYQARQIRYAADSTSAEIWERGSCLGQLRLQVLGSHNLSNALAAVAVGRRLGLEFPVIASALEQFQGVHRRFEHKGSVGGVTFIDDYAHHPSEIRATLRAAHLQQRRVVAVFQPHRHSRLAALFQDFARCFQEADAVVIVPTYGAGEPAPEYADGLRLAIAVAEHHPNVRYVPCLQHLPEVLPSVLQPGDLVVFLGAGDLNQQIAPAMRAYGARVEGHEQGAGKGSGSRGGGTRTTAPPQLLQDGSPGMTGLPGPIQAGIRLAPLTTFRVGGRAEWYGEPQTHLELRQWLAWARAEGIPTTLLGAGSNLLISDAGLGGLVIGTRRLRGIQLLEGGRIWAAAGEPLVNLSRLAAKQGWSGLEWAIGIPGTVGGAVVMNAGAHARAMSDVLVEVQILDEEQELYRLGPEDLQFGYRRSRLQDSPWTVVGATLQLIPGRDPAQVQRETQHNLSQRLSSQPYHYPSCGSVFRNPEAHPAGWLIEQVGLKGYRIGGAQISERHANFILNCDQATASDIYRLIRLAQERVYQRWSVLLQPEVCILGSFDEPTG